MVSTHLDALLAQQADIAQKELLLAALRLAIDMEEQPLHPDLWAVSAMQVKLAALRYAGLDEL